MGWKSTITITRNKAIELIISKAVNATDDESSFTFFTYKDTIR